MKPNIVENCKRLNTCSNGQHHDCVGCNVWNLLYDYGALVKWCANMKQDIKKVHFDLVREYLH